MRGLRWSLRGALALALAWPGLGWAAKDWDKPPAAEMELKDVDFAPGAPAVTLLSRGKLVLSDRGVSSFVEIHERLKVLKEEGKQQGTISIPSSDFSRLKELKARVVLPDGREVPLPKDAKFTKEDSEDFARTTFAMPEVAPGAIVEYSYKIYFDSNWYTRPWYFQGGLPTLRSEFTVVMPNTIGATYHMLGPKAKAIEPVQKRGAAAMELNFSVENLPAIPDEPWRAPFEDLATGVVVVTRSVKGWAMAKDWPAIVDAALGSRDSSYSTVRANDAAARRKGKELAEGAAGPREIAQRIHLFVRDSIQTIPWRSVWPTGDLVDAVLAEGRGAEVNKSLLLQAMLRGAGIEAHLGWTAPRSAGAIVRAIPSDWQLEKVLVLVEVEGQKLYLDPSDRRVAFGALSPQLEGASCLVIDKNPQSPEWLTLPDSPFGNNGRKATVQLALDAEGGFAGTGRLELTGHYAWARIDWRSTQEATVQAWHDFLTAEWPGYKVSDVEVKEDRDARRVEVGWKFAQPPEDVAGDEAAIALAAPLVRDNPFTLPLAQRKTPVRFPFSGVDEVEAVVTWPEGWEIDRPMKLQGLRNWAGALEVAAEVDGAGRRLSYRRRFEMAKRDTAGAGYDFLRTLFQAAATADAERLVLIRP